jgi:hypothetical protein
VKAPGWWLVAALLVLNTADILSSYYAVSVKGASELNPVARGLYSAGGWLWMYVYKVSVPWAVLFFYYVLGPEKPSYVRLAKALVYYLLYIVANNILLLLLP